MAVSSEEENPDKSKIIESENISDQISPAIDTEGINQNQETENMEVHKHPHHVAHKKKWKEYLLEFFMLFFAVFLGFVAENQREHMVEHQREQTFAHSLAADLRQDINQLTGIIESRLTKNMMMDSLLYLLNSDLKSVNGNDVYFYARWLPRTYRFYSNDRTFLQLKNAGNWRLIRNDKVSAKLQLYDQQVRTIVVYIEGREELLVQLLYPSLFKLFNNQVFESMVTGLNFKRPLNNPQLLSYDPGEINAFCNQIHFLKNANSYFIENARTLLKRANETHDLLRKEYHIQ